MAQEGKKNRTLDGFSREMPFPCLSGEEESRLIDAERSNAEKHRLRDTVDTSYQAIAQSEIG